MIYNIIIEDLDSRHTTMFAPQTAKGQGGLLMGELILRISDDFLELTPTEN